MLARHGLRRVLEELHPQIRWTKRGLSCVDRSGRTVLLDERGLVLMPSAYVRPEGRRDRRRAVAADDRVPRARRRPALADDPGAIARGARAPARPHARARAGEPRRAAVDDDARGADRAQPGGRVTPSARAPRRRARVDGASRARGPLREDEPRIGAPSAGGTPTCRVVVPARLRPKGGPMTDQLETLALRFGPAAR